MRRSRVLAVAGLLAVFLLLPLVSGEYYVHLFALVFTNVMLAASLRPSLLCGQLNIGHSAFMCVGAYTSALLAKTLSVPFEVSLVSGALLATAVGIGIGYPSLRLRGVYFAMVTVAFVEVIRLVAQIWKSIGMADNLAQSLGVNVANHKLMAFALGCFFAGVAGAFYAHFIRFLFPPEFGFLAATNILVYNFVGGRGHFLGPVVGAVFLSLLSEPFRGSAYETIFFSIAMLLTILFVPGGLITLPAKLAGLRRFEPVSAPSQSPAA